MVLIFCGFKGRPHVQRQCLGTVVGAVLALAMRQFRRQHRSGTAAGGAAPRGLRSRFRCTAPGARGARDSFVQWMSCAVFRRGGVLCLPRRVRG